MCANELLKKDILAKDLQNIPLRDVVLVARINFRAESQNGNAVVEIITTFNQI